MFAGQRAGGGWTLLSSGTNGGGRGGEGWEGSGRPRVPPGNQHIVLMRCSGRAIPPACPLPRCPGSLREEAASGEGAARPADAARMPCMGPIAIQWQQRGQAVRCHSLPTHGAAE
jgi:hypothetical protein